MSPTLYKQQCGFFSTTRTVKVLQTCQPPRDKNLEILNLELGKEVRSREKLWNFSIWKDFQLGLLPLEVTYHFKATIVDQMHLLGIFFRLSLLQYRSKVSWHSKLKTWDLILVGKQTLLMLLQLFGKRTFPDRMRHLLSTWESS